MPLTPQQIEHKFRQHDSEIVTIYDMLAEIKETVTAHDARFDAIDGRLDGIGARLDAHDSRFDAIDGRLAAHDSRFDAIDGRLDGHDSRFDRIDATLTEVLRRLPEPQ